MGSPLLKIFSGSYMALKERKVIQCYLDGSEIHIFDSAKQAASAMNSKWAMSIYRSIRYGFPAFGYLWKYEGCELTKRGDLTPGKKRKIVSKDISTGKKRTHASISQASRELGVAVSSIESSLLTGCKAKGYIFYYSGESPVPSAKKNAYRKAVVALNDQDDVVREWPSVHAAAKELGVTIGAIYQCLGKDSQGRKCKDYRWAYKL